MGGEKASEKSAGERPSADDTLESRLRKEVDTCSKSMRLNELCSENRMFCVCTTELLGKNYGHPNGCFSYCNIRSTSYTIYCEVA